MKYKRFLALCLSLAILLSFSSCKINSDKKYSIYVITKSTNSNFWNDVESGVKAAATEYNVDVVFEGPSSEEDYMAQNKMISEAVENKADAIVISAIDYDRSNETVEAAVMAGVKVVMIDSDISSVKKSTFIGTDNFAAGEMAAKSVIDKFGTEQNVNIGIINYAEGTDNGQLREDGFRSYLNSFPNIQIYDTVTADSNTTSAMASTIILLNNHPKTDVIVGFNEWMTLGIGKAVEQRNTEESIYAIGFDNNVVSVGMLESGAMDVLIVQNSFAIGYLGIESACKVLGGKKVSDKITTATTLITKENMFYEENQKILFPFN